MNIFYAVQVPNTTKKDGKFKWLLRNDACINIMVGIISCLLDNSKDFKFIIKVPYLSDVEDLKKYEELFEPKYHNRISFFQTYIPISPIYSRFHFSFEDLNKHSDFFNFEDINIMINDENTLTKNWNAFFHLKGLNIPIISTNYFLDSPLSKKVPEKVRYYERQMETFINSDLIAFQCEASKMEALEAFSLLYKDKSLIKNTTVWNTGAYAKEITKYNNLERFSIPTIYFGNRITDTANRYTNWHKFAEAIGLLLDLTKIRFNAIMLNPTHKISIEQLQEINDLSKGKIHVIGNDEIFTREDYLKFINRAHISCNLFTNEVHGGVTHCEALLARNIVVMPYLNNYKYKIDLEYPDYPFTFPIKGKEIDAGVLANRIAYALQFVGTPREKEYNQICFNMGYKYESYESASEKIKEDILKLCKKEK